MSVQLIMQYILLIERIFDDGDFFVKIVEHFKQITYIEVYQT